MAKKTVTEEEDKDEEQYPCFGAYDKDDPTCTKEDCPWIDDCKEGSDDFEDDPEAEVDDGEEEDIEDDEDEEEEEDADPFDLNTIMGDLEDPEERASVLSELSTEQLQAIAKELDVEDIKDMDDNELILAIDDYFEEDEAEEEEEEMAETPKRKEAAKKKKQPPVCKKCGKKHWPFQPCEGAAKKKAPTKKPSAKKAPAKKKTKAPAKEEAVTPKKEKSKVPEAVTDASGDAAGIALGMLDVAMDEAKDALVAGATSKNLQAYRNSLNDIIEQVIKREDAEGRSGGKAPAKKKRAGKSKETEEEEPEAPKKKAPAKGKAPTKKSSGKKAKDTGPPDYFEEVVEERGLSVREGKGRVSAKIGGRNVACLYSTRAGWLLELRGGDMDDFGEADDIRENGQPCILAVADEAQEYLEQHLDAVIEAQEDEDE